MASPAEVEKQAAARVAEALISAVPDFREFYEDNIENYDEFLFVLFFWDVTQATVRSYLGDQEEPDWRSTLGFMEAAVQSADEAERNVVAYRFLYNLPNPGTPGHELVGELGPELTKRYARLLQGN